MFKERWPDLKSALVKDHDHSTQHKISRFNHYSSQVPTDKDYEFLTGVSELQRDSQGLFKNYIMDIASYWAAKALDVQSGDAVLDMCAAPGGKTLILAEALMEAGELIANEVSASRRERLIKVIQQYIPRENRDRFFVTGRDGGKFALTHAKYFDRILVDAPCSGERHLLQSPMDLKEWTPNRSAQLAQRQYALLTSALMACKPGGRILYSTCALSELENDAVIERLIKKKANKFPFSVSFDYWQLPWVEQMEKLGCERTQYGVRIWPDKAQGAGPIYFALLTLSV